MVGGHTTTPAEPAERQDMTETRIQRLVETVETFHVAPEDQGQTVEHAWGRADGDWDCAVVLRITDRSYPVGHAERVRYEVYQADDSVDWQPWNESPAIGERIYPES